MTKQERIIMLLAVAGLVAVLVWQFKPKGPTTITNTPAQDSEDIAPAYLSYNIPQSVMPILTSDTPSLSSGFEGGFGGFTGDNAYGCCG